MAPRQPKPGNGHYDQALLASAPEATRAEKQVRAAACVGALHID